MNSAVTVTKRSGASEPFDTEKVRRRLERVSKGLDRSYVDINSLTKNVSDGVYDTIPSTKLDELIAQTAAYAVTKHPDYARLGGRLCVTALHKVTSDSVLETFSLLHENRTLVTGRAAPLVSDELWDIVQRRHEDLQKIIAYERDLRFDFFGYKTLEYSYLLRVERARGVLEVVERPQQMFLRVALGIHGEDMERVRETYDLMSQGYFTHATPTLFNAGTPVPQMSSCFLVAMREDSIEGILDTLKQCALISKSTGGIGLHVHNIRADGSYISGTNRFSNGLVPMLRVFNNIARFVDQGGGKRKGAFAVYLEPWHADIFDFLKLKKNTGKEEQRARDLFYGLWVPDLFMKRVESGDSWTLMDPNTAPGLSEVYGEEFDQLYERYEEEGRGIRTISSRELWFAIIESQMETGGPFMLYKDSCNRKSNQKNLGTIKCSNLCTEIIEYTSKDEVAVCTLASIALPRFVISKDKFDHQRLYEVTKIVTKNLNRIIDRTHYPLTEAKNSNTRNRPIGIGVQGLADAFAMMRLPFVSPGARQLNEEIFETIYYAAVEASVELAVSEGPYERFAGSPASEGKLQFDLWGKEPTRKDRWDWNALKERVKTHGMRNSLLVAPMPTASTSQILGNNECFEPFTSNIYVRRVLSGEFPVVNKYLVTDLIERGLWNDEIRNQIIAFNGSVQGIKEIPDDLKELYKVVWEMKQRDLIDMAADRGKYIDQSQSLNLFLETPTCGQMTSMHFYTWRLGLKTGMYYLRSKPAADAIKFTIVPKQRKELDEQNWDACLPSTTGSRDCLNCGS